MDKSH